jgi:putative Mn2+ efflux pump MntP
VKVEALIFNVIALLFVIAGVVYGVWAQEPIGTTALFLSAGLTGLIGLFFWFVSRRIDLRPEDREDGEIIEGAGEIGFFSPGSYWPFGIALAASVAGIGLAFWMWWLIAAGLIMVIFSACGMLFEYYSGTRHTAEH